MVATSTALSKMLSRGKASTSSRLPRKLPRSAENACPAQPPKDCLHQDFFSSQYGKVISARVSNCLIGGKRAAHHDLFLQVPIPVLIFGPALQLGNKAPLCLTQQISLNHGHYHLKSSLAP
jgi:hypothetical protein